MSDNDEIRRAVQTGAQIAGQVAERLGLAADRIETVTFQFTDLDGPDVEWFVRRFHWSEGLSQTYELTLDILTPDLSADCDALLGAQAAFDLERGDMLRTVYGIIHRVDYFGITSDKQLVRVYVVPALRLLSQQVDTRVFQGLTVVEIIEQVLSEAFAEYGREVDVANKLKGTYNRRDYCVQYRESDLDFVSRLMEEAGIGYYFESDDEAQKEKLVLCDNNNDYGAVPTISGEEIPIITDRAELADRESLSHFDWCQSEQINAVVARGFNWKTPSASEEHMALRSDEHHDRGRELYDHDDRRQIVDDHDDPAFTGEDMPQREPASIKSMELFQQHTQRGQGRGNVTGMMPGLKFMLLEHTRPDVEEQKFLLTRVVHTGEAPEQTRGAEASATKRYENTFECIPEFHVFRPPVITPKPRVYGPDTATVVGPENEEIHTDEHGRIRVRFHWERNHDGVREYNECSCWIRCAQTWAGPGWGTWFIPRIGMEVVVEFLEGNPDRPLVSGCVYNGDNPPPYTLPDDKTKSTLKSNSSLGGDGYNEFRFEDLKGSEEIFTHAQKDYNEVVENNHTTTVHANQTNSVDGNQANSVGGNQTQSVTGDQTETVTGEQKMTVEKNRTVTINGSQSVTITGGEANSGVCGSKLNITGDYKVDASNTVELQAPTHMKFTVGGSSIFIEPGKITIAAGGKAKLVLDATALMSAAGKGQLKLDTNVLAAAADGGQVKLTADAVMQADGGGNLKLTADAALSGAKTTAAAKNGASLELTCDAALDGANVTVSGKTEVAITADTVKVN